MSDHVGMIVRTPPPCLPVLLFVTASFLGDLKVYVYIYIYLVGGFNPSEKYESQLGLLFPIYVKKMFQTTNQISYISYSPNSTTHLLKKLVQPSIYKVVPQFVS